MKLQSALSAQYPHKAELHTHTKPCSRCGQVPPEEVVEKYLAIGCSSLAITNHLLSEVYSQGDPHELAEQYLADYYAAKKAAEGTDLSVLLGVEIRFSENGNDYLIYGIEPADVERMIPMLNSGIEAFYRAFKNDRNLIIQAHPFRKNMVLAPLDSIDGVESFNLHPFHNSRVALAAKYAKENGLLVTGGTDYHDPTHEGLCLLRTAEKIHDSYELAEVLKSRDYLFDISDHLVIPPDVKD